MTTTPELSREQRDAAMVERYADGETLDALPRGHGSWMNSFRSVQD
ncbi:hypothetical protein [Arthrobacter sp. NicSoilB4]|nr:hypothetical protein [Arthrobacter sp. NicSoilB4]